MSAYSDYAWRLPILANLTCLEKEIHASLGPGHTTITLPKITVATYLAAKRIKQSV
jgi:hypothetical protein